MRFQECRYANDTVNLALSCLRNWQGGHEKSLYVYICLSCKKVYILYLVHKNIHWDPVTLSLSHYAILHDRNCDLHDDKNVFHFIKYSVKNKNLPYDITNEQWVAFYRWHVDTLIIIKTSLAYNVFIQFHADI